MGPTKQRSKRVLIISARHMPVSILDRSCPVLTRVYYRGAIMLELLPENHGGESIVWDGINRGDPRRAFSSRSLFLL